MKRSKLAAVVTVALGVALSVGATAPAATAKPHKDRPAAAAKADKADRGHGKAHKTRAPKPSKADRKLAAAERTALRRIDRKDEALSRYADRIAAAELAHGAAVLANITTDQADLAGLVTTVEEAATRADVRAVDIQVRGFRPSNYAAVLTGLQQAAHFDEVVLENTARIAELSAASATLAGYDVTAVTTTLAAAEAANQQVGTYTVAAMAKGLALTAQSKHGDKEAFRADLAAAGDLLETVEAQLQIAEDALSTAVPVVTEPVITEPVITEPVV